MTLIESELHNRVEISPLEGIRFIGFDMDGTLLDTMPQFPVVFGQYIQEHFGLSVETAGEWLMNTLGTPTHKQIQLLLEHERINTQVSEGQLLDMGKTIDAALANIVADPFPDVAHTLELFCARGYRLFVSSSHKTESIDWKLESVGLRQYFEYIVGKDPHRPEFSKGEPHFRAAAENFGVPYKIFIESVIYVGDALSDITSAVAAHAIAIGRQGTRKKQELMLAGATFVLDELPELLPLLAKYNPRVYVGIDGESNFGIG